jgi:hypothetical protein
MMPDSSDFDNKAVIQYVISYMTCGMCGGTYRLQDVQVIDEGDAMWAMVARCPHCGAEGLILAFVSPLDEEAPDGPFTTSRWDDEPAPLTERDVEEWRSFLQGFHGDMDDLLRADV